MGKVQRGRKNGWFIQIISWRVKARGWGVPLMKFCFFFNFQKLTWLFVAFICSKTSSHFNVVRLKPYSLELPIVDSFM